MCPAVSPRALAASNCRRAISLSLTSPWKSLPFTVLNYKIGQENFQLSLIRKYVFWLSDMYLYMQVDEKYKSVTI